MIAVVGSAGAAMVLLIAACGGAPRAELAAASAGQQIFHPSASAPAAALDHFTGRVSVDRLSPAAGGVHASTGYVTFEPGARSAWHTHDRGQYLVVTAGVGLTQEWGKPAAQLRAGDVVWCPPGVKHWHGATSSAAMTHLAVTGVAEDGQAVRWLELVSDEQYAAAGAAAGATASPPVAEPTTAADPLSAKQRAIPLIAAFLATSDRPRLNAALHDGLDAGLTLSECKEILVQLYAYAGFPRSLNALDELMKVVEARKLRGVRDEPGREPSRSAPQGDALIAIGTANQTRISGAPVRGPVFDFAPIINQFLQAHLFGDIFERDNLDWQSRELATVGALSATLGTEPQLRSHLAASLRVGLTVDQLRRVTEVLATRVDEATGARARAALAQVLAKHP